MDKLEFGGDRMVVTEHANGSATIKWDDKGTGRTCGSCNLCCKLVPVPAIGKQAGERCRHMRHGKGCRIYADRPNACRSWSCRWLAFPEARALSRPDRSHCVVDMEWDSVTMTSCEDGTSNEVPALQVWVDPAYRDAWRSREMQQYLHEQSKRFGCCVAIRYSRTESLIVFPPAISSDRQWHEQAANIVLRNEKERREARLLGDIKAFT